MTPLSIFDVDRTLTRRPTYSAFLLHAAWTRARWRLGLLPLLLVVALFYALGIVPRRTMKEAMHALLLGRSATREQIEAIAATFAERLLERGLYSAATARIEAERSAGRRIILATAAPLFYVAPLARLLGVTEVVATGSIWREGCLSHRIDGENCYGSAKRAMIEARLAALGIERGSAHVRFFSDHHSDVATFDWVDEPIAVNPSPALRAIARERGWATLDWRVEDRVRAAMMGPARA